MAASPIFEFDRVKPVAVQFEHKGHLPGMKIDQLVAMRMHFPAWPVRIASDDADHSPALEPGVHVFPERSIDRNGGRFAVVIEMHKAGGQIKRAIQRAMIFGQHGIHVHGVIGKYYTCIGTVVGRRTSGAVSFDPARAGLSSSSRYDSRNGSLFADWM